MKRITLLPLLMLLFAFIVQSCSQESMLSKEDAKFNLATIHDSIPNDTTDTIPTDTIPTDTIPNTDTTYKYIAGLKIRPYGGAGYVHLQCKTTNYYPVEHVVLSYSSDHTSTNWIIDMQKTYPILPFNP